MVDADRFPEFDPIADYWTKQFGKEISKTERFQIERSLKHFSLTDPLTFIIAHLIHAAHVNASEREGKFLEHGEVSADLAEQLVDLHIRLRKLLVLVQIDIRSLLHDAERLERLSTRYTKAQEVLEKLGLARFMKPAWHAVPAWAILIVTVTANLAVELIFT